MHDFKMVSISSSREDYDNISHLWLIGSDKLYNIPFGQNYKKAHRLSK